jgi:hypothetical protein
LGQAEIRDKNEVEEVHLWEERVRREEGVCYRHLLWEFVGNGDIIVMVVS